MTTCPNMAMTSKRSHEEMSSLSEINVTPLVDVMLVLLIIFMVTAPMMQEGVSIDLPEVNANAVSTAQDDMILNIAGEGQLYFGSDSKTGFSLEALGEKLNVIYENKEKKELYLRADKNIPYGYVVKVMALCQKAGIERVGMVTEPENASQ